MQLNVREASNLMRVSEKTIYRWIKGRKLPAFRINDQYRFNRAELLEWVTAQRVNVSVDILSDPDDHNIPKPELSESLQAGGIHYRVNGSDRRSVLKEVVQVMSLPEEVNRSFLPVMT